MKTLFALIVLIILGVVANFVTVFVLNIAGLPGALLAIDRTKVGKARFNLATIIVVLCQSYVYLAYTTFIVNWTLKAGRRDDVPLGFLLWLPAFLVVMFPIWNCLMHARMEAQEQGIFNAQVEALHATFLVTLLG